MDARVGTRGPGPTGRSLTGLVGLGCLIGLWWWASGRQPAYALPSPGGTWRALVSMASTGPTGL